MAAPLICSIRLTVRTLPFQGGNEEFDSPIEYHNDAVSPGAKVEIPAKVGILVAAKSAKVSL